LKERENSYRVSSDKLELYPEKYLQVCARVSYHKIARKCPFAVCPCDLNSYFKLARTSIQLNSLRLQLNKMHLCCNVMLIQSKNAGGRCHHFVGNERTTDKRTAHVRVCTILKIIAWKHNRRKDRDWAPQNIVLFLHSELLRKFILSAAYKLKFYFNFFFTLIHCLIT
jgi:hypothetical protein